MIASVTSSTQISSSPVPRLSTISSKTSMTMLLKNRYLSAHIAGKNTQCYHPCAQVCLYQWLPAQLAGFLVADANHEACHRLGHSECQELSTFQPSPLNTPTLASLKFFRRVSDQVSHDSSRVKSL